MSCFVSDAGNTVRSVDKRPLQEWAESYTNENKVPGMLIGVWQDGQEVAYVQSTSPMLAAMGKEHSEKMAAAASSRTSTPTPAPAPTPKWEYGRETAFRIFSMTKPVTSACIQIAVEQGKISLDDHVCKFIPGVAEMEVRDVMSCHVTSCDVM